MIFLRGIGCNWLVCLACYFGIQGRDLTSKVVGIWWPIFAFVSLGFDHVVANMTFIPMAIWVDAPSITVGLYIWKGIIPTLLGNIIGGGLFCGKLWKSPFCRLKSHICSRHILLVHVPPWCWPGTNWWFRKPYAGGGNIHFAGEERWPWSGWCRSSPWEHLGSYITLAKWCAICFYFYDFRIVTLSATGERILIGSKGHWSGCMYILSNLIYK